MTIEDLIVKNKRWPDKNGPKTFKRVFTDKDFKEIFRTKKPSSISSTSSINQETGETRITYVSASWYL